LATLARLLALLPRLVRIPAALLLAAVAGLLLILLATLMLAAMAELVLLLVSHFSVLRAGTIQSQFADST
jgi:hypothetical protein